MSLAPYREGPLPRVAASRRLRYWPSFGLWPLFVTLACALPLALTAAHDGSTVSSVVCATEPTTIEESPCVLRETPTSWERIPCRDAPEALERILSPSTPLAAKQISVTRTETRAPEPAGEDRPRVLPAVIPALRCVAFLRPDEMGAGSGRDAEEEASTVPLPAPSVTRSEDVDASQAREWIHECALASPTAGAGAGASTVSVLVTERNFLLSALVSIAAFPLAIALMLRRRVRIDVDGGACALHVTERGWFRLRRSLSVPAPLIRGVVVAQGEGGLVRGRRVELVGFDGSRVPLASGYSVLTWRVHQRTAVRLVEALGVGATT